jgi:anthranilate synthase component 2
MSRIVVVDNYDSFTYNLVHYFEELSGEKIAVIRNDQVYSGFTSEYDCFVLSPGPGLPEELDQLIALSGDLLEHGKKVLGVCLGHQALAMATGARLKNLEEVHHGVSHRVHQLGKSSLFESLPGQFSVGRYHSWVVDEPSLSTDWIITCRDEAGEIMAMEHRDRPAYGIQFHPESVLTPEGKKIIQNFLNL